MSAAESEMIAGSSAVASISLSSSAITLSLLITAVILYYIYFRISRRHMIELAEKIPGPEGLPLIGNALMFLGTSDSSKWRAHRKLIAPTFHLNILKSFIDLFNANSRAVVERMRKEGDKEFNCHDYMSECTVEIILEAAMGVSTQDRSSFEYVMAVRKQVSNMQIPDLMKR